MQQVLLVLSCVQQSVLKLMLALCQMLHGRSSRILENPAGISHAVPAPTAQCHVFPTALAIQCYDTYTKYAALMGLWPAYAAYTAFVLQQ